MTQMNFKSALEVLRPLAVEKMTASGVRTGFFMADATRALGSLACASNALTVLLLHDLVSGHPVVIGDDVHTLYCLTGVAAPDLH